MSCSEEFTDSSDMLNDIRITAAAVQGGRRYMEDRMHIEIVRKDDNSLDYIFAGVYDGHGGPQASEYVRSHLLENIRTQKFFESTCDSEVLHAIRLGFLKTHQNMQLVQETWPRTASGYACTAGTTVSCVFIRNGKMYSGHVGDSAVFLFSNYTGNDSLKDKKITEDHKPEDPDERSRIELAGGAVLNKAGVSRVVWSRPIRSHRGPIRRSTSTENIPFLAIARSLGDFWSLNPSTKEFVVSPEPDLNVQHLTDSDEFIVLATDGLTNVLNGKHIATILERTETEQTSSEIAGIATYQPNFAHSILQQALERWGTLRADNISLICLKLKCLDLVDIRSHIAVEDLSMDVSRELRNYPTACIRIEGTTTQRLLTNPVRLVYSGVIDSVIKNSRFPNGCTRQPLIFEGPGFVIPEMPRKDVDLATEAEESNQEVPDIPSALDQSISESIGVPTSCFVQASTSTLSRSVLSPYAMLESIRSSTSLARSGYLSPLASSYTYIRTSHTSLTTTTNCTSVSPIFQTKAVSIFARKDTKKRSLPRDDDVDEETTTAAPPSRKRSRLWSYVNNVIARYTS